MFLEIMKYSIRLQQNNIKHIAESHIGSNGHLFKMTALKKRFDHHLLPPLLHLHLCLEPGGGVCKFTFFFEEIFV